MTVMGVLAPIAGMIKIRSRNKADIDSPFFKLHYRTTATILFICCILVTANDLIGKTIDCMSGGGGIPGNVLNTYCWIMATFSVPGQLDAITTLKSRRLYPSAVRLVIQSAPNFGCERITGCHKSVNTEGSILGLIMIKPF